MNYAGYEERIKLMEKTRKRWAFTIQEARENIVSYSKRIKY